MADQLEQRQLSIELPAQMWKRIDRLADSAELGGAEELLTKLLDHVQQGVYRSGAWERDWLEQCFGPDAVEAAYQLDEEPL